MKKFLLLSLVLCFLLLGGTASFLVWYLQRYQTADTMIVPIEEVTQFEYPEDPAPRSAHYGRYNGRKLKLVQKKPQHFDFIFLPTECNDPYNCKSDLASIIFKDIDVSYFMPQIPRWLKGNKNLELIALIDREWNRQQVQFPIDSKHIEIVGGNGYERDHLHTVSLAKNCLNAGLWEILFFTKDNDIKEMYYQGWFNFPIGHYKKLFEALNNRDYWPIHWKLEHWNDPEGTVMNLNKLRKITSQKSTGFNAHLDEYILVKGEQKRKGRTMNGLNLRRWKDFTNVQKTEKIQFATFVKPGRYDVNTPWKNEFWRIQNLSEALIAKVESKAPQYRDQELIEIELIFTNTRNNQKNRFIVSGLEMDQIPQLPISEYNKGLYLPMGIAVPPFYQSIDDLKANPPEHSPYFSVLLDENDVWLNHHDAAMDGPVIHRDLEDPNLIHIYLLSYERNSLVGHYSVRF